MTRTLLSFTFPRALTILLACCAAIPAVGSTICPSTPSTTSDCDFLITIGTNGSATVMTISGSTPFNTAMTFTDGTSDPGGDASLIGVVNNYWQPLTSLTLQGSGAGAGIFDFTSNGICVYSGASYCGTAASGYEGPTTTFSNLQSTVPFETNLGTVNFNPSLAPATSTYFAIEDAASAINANGGLTVSGLTFAETGSTTPEPSPAILLGVGLAMLLVFGRRLRTARS